MLDTIGDHAFVVRRWHTFARAIETYLQRLPAGDEAEGLKAEFYRVMSDLGEGAEVPPPENPNPVVVRHVKWRSLGERVIPTGNTTQLEKLPLLARGTLIFIPEEDDYGEERDEFSREPAG